MTLKSSGARSGGWKHRSNAPASGKKLVFLHYPPLYLHYTCPEILHVLSGNTACMSAVTAISTATCCRSAFIGESEGVRYRLVSADFLDFVPYKLR